MPRNGAGTYELVDNGWNPAVDGNSATPDDWQELIDDVAAALTQSLSSDGQTPMEGDLQMGNNQLSDLGEATGSGQALEYTQLFDQGQETAIASAATTDIAAINSNFVRITGTTTITDLGASPKGPRFVRFTDELTLTNDDTTLSLPGGEDIVTAENDRAIFVPKSGGWNCVLYQRAAAAVSPSGQWTPTATAGANVTSCTGFVSNYARVGDMVTFSGAFSATPVGNGSCVVTLSLPIASDFTDSTDAGGCFYSPGALVAGQGGAIAANVAGNVLTLQWVDTRGAILLNYGFSGTYIVR